MDVRWSIKNFDELTNLELYNILKLRMETFIVEQQCVYLDLDDMDQSAMHLFATVDGKLIAYTRIQINRLAVIRRVIVQQDFRKLRLGTELMSKALEYINSLKNISHIELSAQFHLKKFYENLGFHAVAEPYLDTGILHVKMIKQHDH